MVWGFETGSHYTVGLKLALCTGLSLNSQRPACLLKAGLTALCYHSKLGFHLDIFAQCCDAKPRTQFTFVLHLVCPCMHMLSINLGEGSCAFLLFVVLPSLCLAQIKVSSTLHPMRHLTFWCFCNACSRRSLHPRCLFERPWDFLHLLLCLSPPGSLLIIIFFFP